MRIKWIGHACFLITADDGTRIITDPYEPGFRGIISYEPVDESAHIVTVSHQHGDHNWVQGVSGDPTVVQVPGQHTVRGIELTGHPAFHDAVEGIQRGPNIVFTFTVDGLRICHLGDLGHPLSRKALIAIGPVDVLLPPTGGPAATLDVEQLNELWRELSPRVTIPMHFKNDRCSFPPYGVDRFLEGKANVERLASTELELSRDQLPAEPTIVVLEHAR